MSKASASMKRRLRVERDGQPSKDAAKEPLAQRHWLVGALVLITAAAVLLPAARFDFVSLDDPILVYQNRRLDPSTAGGMAYFWSHGHENLYMPVTYTAWMQLAMVAGALQAPHQIYAGEVAPFGPAVFHTANIAVHLVATLLVFLLLRRLVRVDWAAGAGALLFAIHPVQAESVAWVSELKGLLSGLFGILALWLYVIATQVARDKARGGWAALATVALTLALLSKPSAAALPLMAFAIDLLVLRRSWRQAAPLLALWAAISGVFVLVARHVQPVGDGLKTSAPLWARPLLAADALMFYLSKIVFPWRLGIDYGRSPQVVLGQPFLWLTTASAVLLLAVAWRWRSRLPWLPALLGVSAAAVAPMLGFVPFLYQQFSTVADRYLYVAMLGPALALSWSLAEARKRSGCAAAAAWLVVIAALMVGQLGVWRNNVALYEHSAQINPRSWLVHVHLAMAYGKLGRHEDAIRMARMALDEQPTERTYTQLGIQYGLNRQYAEAIPLLQKAMTLHPKDDDARRNLARAENDLGVELAQAQKLDEAVGHWRNAITLVPTYAEAHYNLGIVLDMQGQWDAARAELAEAQRADYEPAKRALEKVMTRVAASRSRKD